MEPSVVVFEQKQREAVEAGDCVEDKNVVVEDVNGDRGDGFVTSKSEWNPLRRDGLVGDSTGDFLAGGETSGFCQVRWSIAESREAETAQEDGEHVENDYREEGNAVIEAPEEIRDVRGHMGELDVTGASELVAGFSIEAEKGTVAESGRVSVPLVLDFSVFQAPVIWSSVASWLRFRSLGVAKPKRHETMENTWKMITEKKAMPLSRHLKKSETFKDTWENQVIVDSLAEPSPVVKKSETFKDRTNFQLSTAQVSSSPASVLKQRKEPSLSQDELNRRVEAFIKKFNEEMRLQRQESLNQ
ncbi:hypothetical protein SLEP1_g52367 [Rubroshorea leprosula]|uniref:Uncharacterized protein n=2 Tax=Rubroshorea leprosula TaxID=152421 RepID=A0AAV5M8N4_9ROSI|nr:hypothetical protein SLEP1_g52367 [Rubroshorea leprosula]